MKISIITVCYNNAETIEDALKSVLSQTYHNIEYIVVDGDSGDGTMEILSRYKGKISKVVSESDKGVYDAMNKGIKLATGDVIGFLNSDDFYADNYVIQKIAEAIQANSEDCCYGDLEYVAAKNISKTIRRWKSKQYHEGLFEKGWHPPHPTFFAKKDIYEKYGGFDTDFHIGADYELMLRFLKKHNIKSRYIPNVLVKMRIGGRSNRNLMQILKANIECYKAWQKNELRISPLTIIRKPISKLFQYI